MPSIPFKNKTLVIAAKTTKKQIPRFFGPLHFSLISSLSPINFFRYCIWDQVFKTGLSKFFKGCLPQTLPSPLLNTLFIQDPVKHLQCSQKQPFRGVLKTRYSQNIQQIYRRIPMPKCDFNKVAKQHRRFCVNSANFS